MYIITAISGDLVGFAHGQARITTDANMITRKARRNQINSKLAKIEAAARIETVLPQDPRSRSHQGWRAYLGPRLESANEGARREKIPSSEMLGNIERVAEDRASAMRVHLPAYIRQQSSRDCDMFRPAVRLHFICEFFHSSTRPSAACVAMEIISSIDQGKDNRR